MKKRVISLAFCLVLMAFSCSTAYAKPTSEEIDAQARGTESHVTSIGNTIYYISGDWLYSISARGRNHKKELLVGTQNEHAKETTWGLQSYNGYLYYRRRVWDANLNKDTDRYNVYRYKPGGKPSVFQANVTEFIIGGNTLYYGTPSGLYIKSINLDTGKKDTLVQGNDKYKLVILMHTRFLKFFILCV